MVEHDFEICEGESRIEGTRTTIRDIVSYLFAIEDNIQELKVAFDLTEEQINESKVYIYRLLEKDRMKFLKKHMEQTGTVQIDFSKPIPEEYLEVIKNISSIENNVECEVFVKDDKGEVKKEKRKCTKIITKTN